MTVELDPALEVGFAVLSYGIEISSIHFAEELIEHDEIHLPTREPNELDFDATSNANARLILEAAEVWSANRNKPAVLSAQENIVPMTNKCAALAVYDEIFSPIPVQIHPVEVVTRIWPRYRIMKANVAILEVLSGQYVGHFARLFRGRDESKHPKFFCKGSNGIGEPRSTNLGDKAVEEHFAAEGITGGRRRVRQWARHKRNKRQSQEYGNSRKNPAVQG
jgi:hypothetical protein